MGGGEWFNDDNFVMKLEEEGEGESEFFGILLPSIYFQDFLDLVIKKIVPFQLHPHPWINIISSPLLSLLSQALCLFPSHPFSSISRTQMLLLPILFTFLLLFNLYFSCCFCCFPTQSPDGGPPRPPLCCPPLDISNSTHFWSGHFHLSYNPPNANCHSSVRIHCWAWLSHHHHQHRIQSAILDDSGRFLAIGRHGKVHLDGICERAEGGGGIWKLELPRDNFTEEVKKIKCVMAKRRRGNKEGSEEEEEEEGKRAQEMVAFFLLNPAEEEEWHKKKQEEV